MKKLEKGQMAMSRGTGRKDVAAFAFGAHFVELAVHARTCEIRVPRMVSAVRVRHYRQPHGRP